MSTVPADVQGPSDAELIDAVRKGTVAAYGSLYERHVGSAYNLARQLTRSSAEADDLVSEAFAKVLDTLRAGRGPDSAFRAYLLTALRHTAYDKTRRDRKLEVTEDVTTVSGVSTAAVSVPFSDTAVAGLERSLAARAFAKLPERWQAVLWHTEVEGQSPAEVAPILGLTPNGVSALAYRAREGLRQAYLQVHLAEISGARCRATADRLGAWTREGLSKRERAQVEKHLDECDQCRALAAELADVNAALREFVAPLVLGSGTAGYLAAAAAAKATAGAVGAATLGAAGVAAGTAGAGGAAGASVPRQFLGVAASAAALAAAIAIAATGGGQDIPQAAPQQTEQPPPPPVPPGPPAPPPVPPAVPPAAPPAPPPGEPQPVPPAPAPQPPSLTAVGPFVPVALIAGGGPADLPITVRNTGGSLSAPVTATLNLPAGVSAISSSAFAGEPLLRLNAPAPRSAGQPTSTVRCPGGTGTVTCSNQRGLQPGEAVTLLFRLVAAEGSQGGEVTGSVSAGGSVNVRVSVPVRVSPPPTRDGVDVHADGGWFDILLPGLLRHPLIHVHATNTGTSTKPITVTVSEHGHLVISSHELDCSSGKGPTTCTTKAPIEPGKKVSLSIKVRALHCHDHTLTVTATLGTASDSDSVRVGCWILWPLVGTASTDAPPNPPTTTTVPPTSPKPPATTPAPAPPVSPPSLPSLPSLPTLPSVPGLPSVPPSAPAPPTAPPSSTPTPDPIGDLLRRLLGG